MYLSVIKLIRPHHWIKNFFVWAPLVFSGRFDRSSILMEFIAFFSFCLASSMVYVINDIVDVDKDRAHPVKRFSRPIASGEISIWQAKCVILILFFFLVTVAVAVRNKDFFVPLCVYIILNIFYSFAGKDIPVVDIFCLSFGFVLRVYAGGEAISVPISPWMLVTTLALALFMASGKRLQEIRSCGNKAREVLGYYSENLLYFYTIISASCSIAFYSMFVVTSKPKLILTIPFVLFGLFRYWYLVEIKNMGESPVDVLIKDVPLILCVLLWVIFVVIFEYSRAFMGA